MGILNTKTKLSLTILNNDKTLYQGEIKSLSSHNEEGSFDILNAHSNFITIIQKEIIVRDQQKEQSFQFDRGVMQCYDNKIRIFLGI